MNKEIVGQVERDIYGSWDDRSPGLYIANDMVESVFQEFEGKKVKITIEILPDEPEISGESIKIKLKNIVKSNAACDYLGLNPWCVSEGADGDDWIEIGEENPPNLIRIPESFDMWDLLVELSLFPSKGQARKDGKWGKFLEIPNGWSEFSFGKKRIGVFVLKFV